MMASNLVLSIFPGIDLLGRAFEAEGFCIVRGPDKLWGGEIQDFKPPRGVFEGIIGGSPCQDFSGLNRSPNKYGMQMLMEFARIINAAQPAWYLLENVQRIPNIEIAGYQPQRIHLNALDCGSTQSRNRVFQWGSRNGYALLVERTERRVRNPEKICLGSEGTQTDRRSWADFCAAMDLPRDFDLPGWSLKAKYKAVGQGVPLKMGRTMASAVKGRLWKLDNLKLCKCGCGRQLHGKQRTGATDACRKRLERTHKAAKLEKLG